MDAICRVCRGNGRTIQQALNEACEKGHGHCAVRLIEAGADVNGPADRDRIPLLIATRKMNYDLIKTLINAGADVNASTCDGLTGLTVSMSAVKTDTEEIVNLLIEAGADVNMPDSDFSTPLMTAVWTAVSPKVITALINTGADVNAYNSYGQCALTEAAVKSYDEGLEILIEAADETDPTRSYLAPLSDVWFETRSLKVSTLKILLRAGFKINVPNLFFYNTLTYYIVLQRRRENRRPNEDICMLLFACGEIVTGPIVQVTARYGDLSAEVPEYLFHRELRMCLKHLCREAIRKHLLELDPHTHLFSRVPRLGLPSLLQSYLLYDQTLNDDDDDDADNDDDDDALEDTCENDDDNDNDDSEEEGEEMVESIQDFQ